MVEREGEVTRVLRQVARTLDRGRYDEALRELMRLSEKYPDAGEIRPQIAEVLLRRGQSRARKGRIREARADFERSLGWAPRQETYVAVAETLLAEGRLEEAQKMLHASLEKDDRHGPTHAALGALFLKWEDWGEAARAFEQALGLGFASPEVYRGVWEAYVRMDRLDRAHELILEGAERFPQDGSLQAAAGDSWVLARGDLGSAIPCWEAAVRIDPRNFRALFSLAGAEASRGRREEALGYLKRCMALDPARTRQQWREDLESSWSRFRDVAEDPDFRRVLGL